MIQSGELKRRTAAVDPLLGKPCFRHFTDFRVGVDNSVRAGDDPCVRRWPRAKTKQQHITKTCRFQRDFLSVLADVAVKNLFGAMEMPMRRIVDVHFQGRNKRLVHAAQQADAVTAHTLEGGLVMIHVPSQVRASVTMSILENCCCGIIYDMVLYVI